MSFGRHRKTLDKNPFQGWGSRHNFWVSHQHGHGDVELWKAGEDGAQAADHLMDVFFLEDRG